MSVTVGIIVGSKSDLSYAREAGTIRRCMDHTVRALADREPRAMPALRKVWMAAKV